MLTATPDVGIPSVVEFGPVGARASSFANSAREPPAVTGEANMSCNVGAPSYSTPQATVTGTRSPVETNPYKANPDLSAGGKAAFLREVSRILADGTGSRQALGELLGLLRYRFDTPVAIFEVESCFGRMRLVMSSKQDEFADYVGLEPRAISVNQEERWESHVRGTPLMLLRLDAQLVLAILDLGQFAQDDYELLEQIAPAVRVAAATFQEERSDRWLARRVRANQRLVAGLESISDTSIPWTRLAAEARLLTGAHSALIVEVHPHSTRVVAAVGETLRKPGDLIDQGTGILAWVVAAHQSVLIGSLADRTSTQAEALSAIRGESVNDAAVVAPVLDPVGALVGLIAVFSPNPYRFSLRDLETIEELATFAGALVAQRQTVSFVAPGLARDELAAEVLDMMLDGVAVVDDDHLITLHNRAFARLHGAEGNASLQGMYAADLESERRRTIVAHGALLEEEERRRLDGTTFMAESYRRRFFDPASGISGTLLAIRDIQERAAERQRVRQLAQIDPLTGLNNRSGFFELAGEFLGGAHEELVGLLFIDVDGLKVVNDQFGHAIGDRVLIEVADRMRHSMRPHDVMGRIGGDEFAVLVCGAESTRSIRQVGERLATAISSTPIALGSVELRVTAAVGVATGVTPVVDLDQLISVADSAMYQDKFTRRRPDLLHLQRGSHDAVEIELGPDLVRVLRGDERGGSLLLRFQPLFDARSRAITSVETLVRWQHPKEGLLLPGRFLSLALQYRLMDQLDAFVRMEAMSRYARWREAGLVSDMRLSINLSGVNAAESRTVRDFCQLADRLEIPRDSIIIELTETELSDLLIDRIARMMRRLKQEGFLIALDDFGVGTSSFRHLQIMPVDVVKIDRQFVKDLGSGGDRGLVAGLTALAGELGISVVAEGVGDQACLDVLLELGVPEVQGFHLARPLREAALLKLLARDEPLAGLG